jgi:hypothetical protein
MTVKVAVIYYSSTGTVHAFAQAVADGAASAGAEVRLRRVAELAPEAAIDENPLWRRHADAATSIALASVEDLGWADAFAFGTPTRFGAPAAQLKQFIDQAGGLWQEGRLAGKPVTAFHLGVQPARRQRGHDLVAEQCFLPLGGADRPARIHRSGRVRRRRQPLRHVCVRPADRRRPRRHRAGRGPVPGTAAGPDHDPAAGGQPRHQRQRERPRNHGRNNLPDRVSGGQEGGTHDKHRQFEEA